MLEVKVCKSNTNYSNRNYENFVNGFHIIIYSRTRNNTRTTTTNYIERFFLAKVETKEKAG